MYGGAFRQRFGWYVAQAALRMGAHPTELAVIEGVAPNDVVEVTHELAECIAERTRLVPRTDTAEVARLINSGNPMRERLGAASTRPEVQELGRRITKLKRRRTNIFENAARAEFGFRPIGERWVSETMLTRIVERLLPDEEIVRHARPPWLDGLELDLWLPGRRLGIEYQGQQHFVAIEAWGGAEALAGVQERDRRKARICAAGGVDLLAIDYREPLTEAHIRARLGPFVDGVL